MNSVFKNIYLLGNIKQFLNVNDLKSFSMVNKEISSKLKKENKEEPKKMIMINNFMEYYPGYTEEGWDNLNIETKGGLKDYIKYYENISEDNKEEINELQENKELISKNRNNDIRDFLNIIFIYLI
jgi:hypothetical protein